MNWFDWVLIALCADDLIGAVYSINKPRDVITPEAAVVKVSILLLLILGIIFF